MCSQRFGRVNKNGEKENASMMKNLVGNIVSVLMEVLMWITFVGCTITGLVFGVITGKESPYGIISMVVCIVFGTALGAIAGMLANILWWMLSTFQEIRNYLKEIAER
jgi:hypothetical protein